jgi:flagellar basal-body rod protein FlgG
MIRALYSAGSGMTAQQMSIDTIANNLANSNTTGFKARRTQFQDLLYQSFLQPGAAAGSQTIVPNGLQLGLGTRPSANSIIFTQGSFTETDNPLDLVIQGKGFFQIQLPNGQTAYTRAGNFQLDKNGNIVNASGDPVQPQIVIPAQAQSITIAPDGTVRAVHAHGCERRSDCRQSGRTGRAGHALAGLPGGVQRERGRGVHQHAQQPEGV